MSEKANGSEEFRKAIWKSFVWQAILAYQWLIFDQSEASSVKNSEEKDFPTTTVSCLTLWSFPFLFSFFSLSSVFLPTFKWSLTKVVIMSILDVNFEAIGESPHGSSAPSNLQVDNVEHLTLADFENYCNPPETNTKEKPELMNRNGDETADLLNHQDM